jgi:hypothetical protein
LQSFVINHYTIRFNHGIGLEPISCDLENQYSIHLKLTMLIKTASIGFEPMSLVLKTNMFTTTLQEKKNMVGFEPTVYFFIHDPFQEDYFKPLSHIFHKKF